MSEDLYSVDTQSREIYCVPYITVLAQGTAVIIQACLFSATHPLDSRTPQCATRLTGKRAV